jgi:maltooligosyltrehalose trehalohydrolase
MLAVYRRLGELRRTLPELTDPAFTHVRCEVDEERRLFVMHRGEATIAVNFGDAPAPMEVGDVELLFETPSGITLADGVLTLPAHAGALVRAGG